MARLESMDLLALRAPKDHLAYLDSRESLVTTVRWVLLDPQGYLENLDCLEQRVETVDQVLLGQRDNKGIRVTLDCKDPRDLLVLMVNMEREDLLAQKEKMESLATKENQVPADPQGSKAQKEILEHLVSPVLLESRDPLESRVSLANLETTVRRETEDFRATLEPQANLEFKDLLANLAVWEHLENKETQAPLVSRAILDHLGPLAYRELLETRVRQDLKDQLVW